MPLKLVPPRVGRSPYWYIRGTIAGRSVEASTKARDKAGARRFKIEFEDRIAQSKPTGVRSGAATFSEAAALYVEFRQPRATDQAAIGKLVAILGGCLLSEIRQHMLVSAAARLYPDCAPETRNRMALGPAAAILHYAADNDLCPYIKVKKLKERRPEPRAVTREVAAALIGTAEGKLKTMLVFLFCQGWRVSDALSLRWEHVDFGASSVRYHVSKTDEWLVMPLHLQVLEMLREERQDIGRVFPWGNKSNLYRALRPLCKRLGVAFTPHMARHSFATWLSAEGVSTKDIMEAGAWRDHKSVMRYTKIDEHRVRSTINKIRT